MSASAQGNQNTTKAVVSDSKDSSQPLSAQKPAAQLEEDDEFEDFPVEGELPLLCTRLRTSSPTTPPSRGAVASPHGVSEANCDIPDWPEEEELGASGAAKTHLWEESWDDDDTSDDFSAQLK